MGMYKTKKLVYDDGRTKQSFRDETDINKILQRAQKTGTISHMSKHEARYGDFSDFDFFENTLMLTKGREIFDDLPSEIRSEFHNSPAGFFKYVNDPANKDRLDKLLPALAEPGRQNLDVSGKAAVAAAKAPVEPEPKKAILDPGVAAETPLDGVTEVIKTEKTGGTPEKSS